MFCAPIFPISIRGTKKKTVLEAGRWSASAAKIKNVAKPELRHKE
jgi:hypothetical protein